MVSSVQVVQAVAVLLVQLAPVLLQVALLAVPQVASWFRPVPLAAVALRYLSVRFCKRRNQASKLLR